MDSLVIFVLTGSFLFFLAIGIPISFSIGLATFSALLISFPMDIVAQVISQKMITALDNFGLLAIPFFILAGGIMNRGGIARRLIELAKLLGGRLPGALAHCNVIANMLFGAISGSAVSSVAAVGGIMGPIQKKEGYDPNFSAAVNIASGPAGLLIPPSGVLILYSLVSGGTSIAALFVAGYLPGLIMGLGLMVVAGVYAKKHNYPKVPPYSLSQSLTVCWEAIPSLILVILVIGGIVIGVFTATEASAVAVVYSLALAFFYKELKVKQLPDIILESVFTTSIIMFLVGASVGMSWAMASANIPQLVSDFLNSLSASPLMVILIINLLLLFIGTFMDLTPAVLIFTPIFLPVATNLGIDPVHFGIIMVFNLCIGICTPPVGSALFVGCSVSGTPIQKVIPHLLPMYFVLIAGLVLVTCFPEISLFLPRIMGLL